jgi:hypothetical protein
MFRKKSKFSCVFCSDKKEKSKDKINFCRDCEKIRMYVRDNGIKSILNLILDNNYQKPTAPPYTGI